MNVHGYKLYVHVLQLCLPCSRVDSSPLLVHSDWTMNLFAWYEAVCIPFPRWSLAVCCQRYCSAMSAISPSALVIVFVCVCARMVYNTHLAISFRRAVQFYWFSFILFTSHRVSTKSTEKNCHAVESWLNHRIEATRSLFFI